MLVVFPIILNQKYKKTNQTLREIVLKTMFFANSDLTYILLVCLGMKDK